MAKGDSSRAQTAINNWDTQLGATTDRTFNTIAPLNQMFQQNYQNAVSQNTGDYNSIMGAYRNFMSPGNLNATIQTGGGSNPNIESAIKGYQGFADTGGFSQGDLQNIRARAISPIRSVYSSAADNLAQQRELQGGFSPNAIAAQAQMARQMSQQTAGASTNAEADIAGMVQQGKLAGLGGLSSTALQEQSLQNQAEQAATAARIQASLGGLSGMSNMYSATPGMASTFGSQVLGSQNQMLNWQDLENRLGMGMTGLQINKAGIPGDFQQAMNNVGDVAKIGSGVAGMFY